MAESLPTTAVTGSRRFSLRTVVSILLLAGLIAGLIGCKAQGGLKRIARLQATGSLLIAGPAVNLASLIVIARQSHWKIALLVAAAVWATAVAGGLLLG